MNDDILHSFHEPAEFGNSIPEDYRGPILQGAKVMTAKAASGFILLQERNNGHHTIQFNLFHFFRQFSLNSVEKNYGLQALLALKSDILYHIKGIGKLHLREGQFAMIHAPEKAFTISVDHSKDYQVFETYYTRDLLEQLIPFFPKLRQFFSKSDAGKTFVFSGSPAWAGTSARNAVNDMLHAAYDENLRRFYFDNKVREYLFLLLVQSMRKPAEKLILSVEENARIIALKNNFANRLGAHLTIPELAKEAGMNEFKLKAAFRQMFGMGIFEFRLDQRMQEALHLLETSDQPMKAIASNTGYDRLTSFITAFRRHFGYTPGSVRRKR
jgi:AraC family transcriptional regulator, transcriptional activator of the genes for pyochelin and ferripyochelin receptors